MISEEQRESYTRGIAELEQKIDKEKRDWVKAAHRQSQSIMQSILDANPPAPAYVSEVSSDGA